MTNLEDMSKDELINLIKRKDEELDKKDKKIKELWYVWSLKNNCTMQYIRSHRAYCF
jgi:hypothetical protein